MQEIRQSTQVKVVIGPVVAVGDGFTPVTTLDLSTADEAEILKHDAAAVTSISAATFAAITSADGYYNLTITTSLSDTLGMMTVLVNDDSLCLPVKAQFMVLTAAEWDRKYTAQGQSLAGIASYGTAQSATATTIVLAAAEAYANDTAIGMTVMAFGSTQGYWQSRVITDYVLATDTATVDTWTVTPSGTISYVLMATPPGSVTAPVPAVLSGTQTFDRVGTLTGNITGNLSGSVGSVTGAVGSVTGAVGSVTGAVGSVGAGGIAAASFAAGAIDATAIANGAIDAATFAAGAIDAAAIAADAIGSSEFSNAAAAKVMTQAMTEAYAADGAAATPAQLLYFLLAALSEFSVSGTTVTLKKLDGSTAAATLTLGDATNPTSITRAT